MTVKGYFGCMIWDGIKGILISEPGNLNFSTSQAPSIHMQQPTIILRPTKAIVSLENLVLNLPVHFQNIPTSLVLNQK